MLFNRVTWLEEYLLDPFLLLWIMARPNTFISVDLLSFDLNTDYRIFATFALLTQVTSPTCFHAGVSAMGVMEEHSKALLWESTQRP